MKVSEVINKVAGILGVEPTGDTLEKLLRAYNLVECELAVCYLPLPTVDKVFFIEDNKIYYSSLHNQVVEIKAIQDARNAEVKFKAFTEYIQIRKNYDGKSFYVKYYRMPRAKTIDDTSEYDAKYFDLMVLGVCAEYWLANGSPELAKIYNDEYMSYIKQNILKKF